MKKYKLIKEYPGSPSLNTKINENGFDGNMTTWCNPKNYPEFWEEIIEKDYEVLSFNDEYKGIYNKKFNNKFALITETYGEFTEDQMLNYGDNHLINIHSVKRLSDGEIFTVGDNVLSKTCHVPNKILSIELIDGKIRLYPRNSFYHLNDIKKIKQPLFITEDGVEIFEGDKFWFINNNFLLSNMKIGKLNKKPEKQNLKFSTKKKAEEYILLNKPCLSINDIIMKNQVSYPSNETLVGITFSKLKELVKQKIKEQLN